ncbi:hypothetical protein CANTEDRAFT_120456 [Yamadazyma tenuis ATCC 10573]|uniref:Ribosome biogenesis protein SLX9 n=1 Tax=Candida tenuis (strain ATCC 10573 / BCRC 21748 / CBS 615 / JCM 9827 / NBRC 10315 / NRRL Y-1498 / VKM Y-70) TaxID=590646 RepID=G3B2E5_CANTC|nr:uncharacterized protein CANTEDRAFT_120456 [Yamadazyma tenuis ATCC 10573]EGV64657.1 hypothetical protein CANTEDRAFT_120456 [Yamadazyma tenuis ATCC 10573]
MGTKRTRTALRAKSTRAATKSVNPKIIESIESNPYDENPFLKLSSITKKEKQHQKTKSFTQRLATTSSSVSKSALRRRKRKVKEALKPKMEELFETLPEVTRDQQTGFVPSDTPHANEPNARKKTGHQVIFKREHENFNHILQNKQFRTSPFATLKQSIQENSGN